MPETQTLVAKRGSIKSSITRIEKFVDQVDDTITINNLKGRLEHLHDLYNKYDETQCLLEVLNEAEYSKHRKNIENKFLDLKGRLRDLIEGRSRSGTLGNSSEPVSSGTVANVEELSMPKIDLPLFEGDYSKWHNFKDLFANLVHDCPSISKIRKLYYLKSYLRGEASTLIECLHASEENYDKAWETLTKRYDNKAILLKTHLSGILDLPHVGRSYSTLRSLLSKFGQHFNSLKSLGVPVEYWDIILVYILSQKLDTSLVQTYESGRNKAEFPRLENFFEFLEDRCSTLEVTSRQESSTKRIATNASQVNDKKCIFCNDNHLIKSCNKFRKISVEQRRKFVREKRLCFKCLKVNHLSDKCFSKENCNICGKKHNVLLHPQAHQNPSTSVVETSYVSSESKENTISRGTTEDTSTDVCTSVISSTEIDFSKNDKNIVLWPLALVYVIDDLGCKHMCRALLDSASEKNYITDDFIKSVSTERKNCNWQVNGVAGLATNVMYTVDLTIESRVSDYSFLAKYGVMKDITGYAPKCEIDLRSLRWPHHITLADPSFNKVGKIDMLLGTEIFATVLKNGKIDLGSGAPSLQNTEFGWVMHGSISRSVNTLTSEINYSLVTSLGSLNETMAKFWKIEETIVKPIQTHEEKICEAKFVVSVSRDDTGRYWVDLPVRENKLNLLGNSFDYAKRCLLSLERRFTKNDKLFNDYKAFIKEYIKLGHGKIVSMNSNDTPKFTFYMPHHAVIKETSSSTKLGVVFNASAPSSSGISLNDLLLVGPVIQPDLISILMRIRTYRYAITADMTKMYRQVMVKPKFQPLQRILWRDSEDKPIECIQLTTVTYGTASASFLATRVLLQLVFDEGDKFPLASNALRNNSYIDDIITGTDTIELGLKLQTELIELLSKGGFELHKWCSNETQLLKTIPLEKREVQSVNLTEDKSYIRTLGIMWNPSSDEFEIAISDDIISDIKPTKRAILSCISKIFDPLGLTGPITARAKMIMQDIWRDKLKWDDQVPVHILKIWIPFKDQLIHLRDISIPRLILVENTTDIQIHGFSDASLKGYGAVIYLRSRDKVGNVASRLVCSKSRVAPLKVISLPRLELCGALLLAQLMTRVKITLKLNVNRTYLWSDSSIVLAWIASDASRWNVFVANRVSEIQELSSKDTWQHVCSRDNPADLVSRGLDPDALKNNALWWFGPPWSLLNAAKWPCTDVPKHDNVDLSEMRPISRVCVAKTYTANYFCEEFTKYSKFIRLQRVMAYVLRFINNLKCNRAKNNSNFISSLELRKSMKEIVRIIQYSNFRREIEEISMLKNSSQYVHIKNNRLHLLNPILDDDNLLRVGGRIKHILVKFNQKHPLILPDKNHVTKLLIIHEHERLLHAGTQHLLASLRQKFWILNARSAIKQVIYKCVKCFRFRATAANQIMSDLPSVRVTPSRPFLNSGVDYAGPIDVRQSRIRKSIITKGYICLFVCMCTKAIHLELVSDMSTKSFLNALNRFISRRGKCAKIFSDNGSNFKRASQELNKLYKMFNETCSSEIVYNEMALEGIEWVFIPPFSPHWGGIWESGIKSVKHHLKRTVGSSALSYEELYTLIVQIEGILNSRPLCQLNSDPDDFECLSPAHFLIGSTITACPQADVSDHPVNRLKTWQQINQMKQMFWKRWSAEYISELQQRKKWYIHKADCKLNDLVLVKEDNTPPLAWALARIIDIYKGKDNHVRSVLLKTKHGTYVRPIVKICPLPLD